MKIKIKEYLHLALQESARDISSLGNPIPLIIIALLTIRAAQNLLIVIIGLAFIEIISLLIKLAFHKSRPAKQKYNDLLTKIDSASFPSAHSARAMFVLAFLALNNPNILLKLLLAVLILSVGASRIYKKKHRLVDVVAGYMLGAAVLYFLV